jgi:hypothetical protein
MSSARQPRRVEHVGTGFGVGAQAGDRVVEIVNAADVVFRARGEHELHRAGMGGRNRGGDPRDGMLEGIDRARLVIAEVLDRAAREARVDRPAHGLRDPRRFVGEAVLEICGHRQLRRIRDRRRVRQRLLPRHRAVAPPERRREPAARRRERLEAQRRQQRRRAAIPRVGQQQRVLARVQRQEATRLVGLDGHQLQRSHACSSGPGSIGVARERISKCRWQPIVRALPVAPMLPIR